MNRASAIESYTERVRARGLREISPVRLKEQAERYFDDVGARTGSEPALEVRIVRGTCSVYELVPIKIPLSRGGVFAAGNRIRKYLCSLGADYGPKVFWGNNRRGFVGQSVAAQLVFADEIAARERQSSLTSVSEDAKRERRDWFAFKRGGKKHFQMGAAPRGRR